MQAGLIDLRLGTLVSRVVTSVLKWSSLSAGLTIGLEAGLRALPSFNRYSSTDILEAGADSGRALAWLGTHFFFIGLPAARRASEKIGG